MPEILFIAAGTKGAKLVAGEFQPFLKVHGRSCIELVVEAAIQANEVGDIYVWGDAAILKKLLDRQVRTYRYRLVVLEERGNIVESFLFAFLEYVAGNNHSIKALVNRWHSINDIDWPLIRDYYQKIPCRDEQVNVIVSDTPFLLPEELDYMIANKNRHCDILVGRTCRQAIEAVLNHAGGSFDFDQAVKNYYKYRIDGVATDLMVNSFLAGRPFRLPDSIWVFIKQLYDHRTIIAGRKKNLKNIANNLKLFRELFVPKRGGWLTGRYRDRLRAAFFLARSYNIIVRGRQGNESYRDLAKIYQQVRQLTGLTIEYATSHCFGAAFDLDTPYEADFARKHFDEIRAACRQYYDQNKFCDSRNTRHSTPLTGPVTAPHGSF